MQNSMKATLDALPGQQANAFEHVPQRSLQLALCLNGTVPVLEMTQCSAPRSWLEAHLGRHHPGVSPGATGPITIVLVL